MGFQRRIHLDIGTTRDKETVWLFAGIQVPKRQGKTTCKVSHACTSCRWAICQFSRNSVNQIRPRRAVLATLVDKQTVCAFGIVTLCNGNISCQSHKLNAVERSTRVPGGRHIRVWPPVNRIHCNVVEAHRDKATAHMCDCCFIQQRSPL